MHINDMLAYARIYMLIPTNTGTCMHMHGIPHHQNFKQLYFGNNYPFETSQSTVLITVRDQQIVVFCGTYNPLATI
jgi:hypothetical protein